MTRREAFDRLERVAAEYRAAAFAVADIVARWPNDPAVTDRARAADVTRTAVVRAAVALEVAFSLRLFSEFEAVLRDYWGNGLGRPTRPDMRPLMDAVARRRSMGTDDLQSAHDVRTFRNSVVHAGGTLTAATMADCQRGLGRYLRWLPQQW